MQRLLKINVLLFKGLIGLTNDVKSKSFKSLWVDHTLHVFRQIKVSHHGHAV